MSTHRVAAATIKPFLRLRERYIELQGMPCFIRRPVPGESRADFFGDIRDDMEFGPPKPFKFVIDVAGMLERVHHTDWGSRDWKVNPIQGEVRIDEDVREGDLISFDLEHLTAVYGDFPRVALEGKYFQVSQVLQGFHVMPVSKMVKIVPYRDNLPGVTE